MVEETTCRPSRSRVAATLGVILAVPAVIAVIAGFLPSELLRPLAGRIRHPADFTPERYQRYLHVCWFFAVSLGTCSAGCFRFREQLSPQIALLRTQICSLVSGVCSFFVNLPAVARVTILAGIGVRAWFLNLPMAYDESFSFINYASRPFYLGIADYSESNNHLFNTLLMHGMYRLFGQQDWALRLPVFCFGIALLPIVWGWACDRFSQNVANIATALVAVSPALVSYSVNARGYLYLTCCAVLLDWALFRIATREENKLAWWCVAWIATVVGAWSMPLMVYPALGMFGWYVLSLILSRRERGEIFRRIRGLIPFGITAAIGVATFYAPAYLFRGMMFLDRIGFDDPNFQVWLTKLPRVLTESASWWLAVAWPIQLLAALCLLSGLGRIARDRTHLFPLIAPFVVAVLMIFVQQVSPPPRVFLYLAPWALLFCACGLMTIVERFSQQTRPVAVLALAIVLSGTAYLVGRPQLFEEAERRDYASIPAAMGRLQAELERSDSVNHRLFAPLPCDVPSIYYMDKLGFRIPVNGEPHPSETLWLLTRPEQSPAETLSTPLIGMNAQLDNLGPWEVVARFDTLVLSRSSRPIQPERTSGF
ncbi:MAG TPA: glycosyltransferase family 39 protein [Planctomycetaceae bacterium]|nr:glycosyltransferase family 39 protein [Planctomycetaceae bacterium]